MNGVIHGGYVHFFSFISFLYMNSDCLFVLCFTVTYVTTLLQLLTEDVLSLVLSLVYEMILKKGRITMIFSRTALTFSCHLEGLVRLCNK